MWAHYMLIVLVGGKMRKAAKRINRFWRSHKKVKHTKDLAGRDRKLEHIDFAEVIEKWSP